MDYSQYEFRKVDSHIEVYRQNRFILSADNYREALHLLQEELEE